MRANKRELPKTAEEKKDKVTLFSSDLYKSEHCTLIAYKSKSKVSGRPSKHQTINKYIFQIKLAYKMYHARVKVYVSLFSRLPNA